MPLNRIDGNLYVAGTLTADAFDAPRGSVGNQQMKTSDPLESDKIRHLYPRVYSQIDGGNGYSDRMVIHVALVAGTVEQFQSGLRDAITGDSTIVVDLLKNGVTVLTDVIDLDSSLADFEQVVGGIDPTKETYAQGDVFEILVTVTDGTGTPGEGLFALATFDEGAF